MRKSTEKNVTACRVKFALGVTPEKIGLFAILKNILSEDEDDEDE